jgi:Na+-translocating ferredoxin:NAD+ oxidoreductase RnfG subunit
MKNIISSLLLIVNFIIGGEIKTTAEEQIRKAFTDEIKIEFLRLSLLKTDIAAVEKEVRQKFFGDFLYTWKIQKDDTLLGIAVLDNVYGKSMPITFLTIFDAEGNIRSAHIIKYRESIGGEVGNEIWLSQFKGKNAQNSFKVGQEVDAISGATISVNSVSRGLKKLTLLFPFIQKKIN